MLATPQPPLYVSFSAPCTVPTRGWLPSPLVPMAASGTNTVYLRQTYAEDVSQYVNINEHTGTVPEIPFAWVEMSIHWSHRKEKYTTISSTSSPVTTLLADSAAISQRAGACFHTSHLSSATFKHRSTTNATSCSTKALLPFIVPGLLRRLPPCHIAGALHII